MDKIQKQPILATTRQTYEELVMAWVRVVKLNDIGFFIWPLFSDPDYRIDQFVVDFPLQKKLHIHEKHIYIHTSFLNNPGPLEKNSIYSELLFALRDKVGKQVDYAYGLIETLQFLEENGYNITFFIEGLDKQMMLNDFGVVTELYTLHQKLKQTSFLFYLQYPVSREDFNSHLLQRRIHTNLISYQGAFSLADSTQFISYLQNKWSIKIDKETCKFLVDTFDLNYGLIKSAIRLIRLNNILTKEQIINNDFVKERARIILQTLPQDLVVAIQHRQVLSPSTIHKHQSILEYLIRTKMIYQEGTKYYFVCSYYETIPFIPLFHNIEDTHFVEYFLSQKEALVFGELKSKQGEIITRERIGDVMWGEEVGELYSEWAIDQAIHRIRQKIHNAHLPYELRTKKGSGFILLAK